MDLKKIIPILAVVAVFVYGGLKIRKGMKSMVEHVAPTATVNPALVKKKLGEYVRQPRANYKALVEANTQIPKACAAYFDQIEALDFANGAQVQYQMLPSADPECVIVDPAYQLAEKTFLEKCVLSNPDKSAVLNEECASALFMMRASVTRVLLKDKAITEVKDIKQLTDLLFAEFVVGNNGAEPDFKRVNSVANQMLAQNPNLYVAAKVAVFTDLMNGMGEKNKANWETIEASLKRAQQLNPNDPSMADTEAAIHTQGFDPQKTIAYAKDMIQKEPNHDRWYFLLAYGQWKANDRNASVQNLQKAIELNPREDYQKTMAEITQPNAGPDSFKGSMSIAVSNEDFSN